MHLALIGYGNIAQSTVAWLAERPVARLTVLVRPTSLGRAQDDAALKHAAPVVQVTDQLSDLLQGAPDLVVECAGHHAVAEAGVAVLHAGFDLVLVSIGAMADSDLAQRLQQAAQAGNAQLILPSGAIGGIDLLSALALAGGVNVTYRGTKPPAAWAGTPAAQACDLDGLREAHVFFEGNARKAATSYPKNANVAATLALAGAGFEATRVALIADPAATGNCHSCSVESPAGRFSMTIENAASPDNAKTSRATVYSVIREINRKRDRVVI
ncbi:L-aspartate dehydrogenase [Roseobacter fucihabitans]|uniref:L-aspartate dehydrogenase n=1 Tax=Roseobacter fucihabitans TaxID=1537242 RepID=A0ABZ2BR59_9RHOB|nr:aspartate dehydrogenase [Roseobacter litoralis]MBC6965396.1 L-aspartate dehydrogenase [Roseobacter litoralis]